MPDHRRIHRKKTFLAAYVDPQAGHGAQPCLVRDLSGAGARILIAGACRLTDTFDLQINGRSHVLHVQTIWRTPTEVGVRLLGKTPLDALESRPAKTRGAGG